MCAPGVGPIGSLVMGDGEHTVQSWEQSVFRATSEIALPKCCN